MYRVQQPFQTPRNPQDAQIHRATFREMHGIGNMVELEELSLDNENQSQAQALKLVDTLQTSDDFLLTHCKSIDTYKISYRTKRSLPQRLSAGVHNLYQQLINT